MTNSAKNPRPQWLTLKLPPSPPVLVAEVLRDLKIATVCAEAQCPNRAECYYRGRATFMLMGDICTRRCRYCAVKSGAPVALDSAEPERVADAASRLQLKHVVITSVTRDDLPDGGAAHFARAVAAIRRRLPETAIEILVPDFGGDAAAWEISAACAPDVYNHNLETVESLFPQVRPAGNFARSLRQLAFVKKTFPRLLTKSGIMAGLGETYAEIIAAAQKLRAAAVDMLTIGQYLPPRADNFPVARYVPPEEFDSLHRDLSALGFRAVACAPLVRSSYHAEETLAAATISQTFNHQHL